MLWFIKDRVQTLLTALPLFPRPCATRITGVHPSPILSPMHTSRRKRTRCSLRRSATEKGPRSWCWCSRWSSFLRDQTEAACVRKHQCNPPLQRYGLLCSRCVVRRPQVSGSPIRGITVGINKNKKKQNTGIDREREGGARRKKSGEIIGVQNYFAFTPAGGGGARTKASET